jgi:hypothetical protein
MTGPLRHRAIERPATARPSMHSGELIVLNDALVFAPPGRPLITVHAPEALALWYGFNPQDWMDGNHWALVHQVGARRERLELADREGLTVLLASWCTAHLPGFDASLFGRLAGSPYRAEQHRVLVWACGRRYADDRAPDSTPES